MSLRISANPGLYPRVNNRYTLNSTKALTFLITGENWRGVCTFQSVYTIALRMARIGRNM
jgi:hypothetical protein